MKLPDWKQVDGRWTCDDPEALKWKISFQLTRHDFSLPVFDRWLSGIEPGEVKNVLLERRAWAIEAARESNAKWLRTALDLLTMVRRGDQREDALLPLAKAGKKSRTGAATANEARSKESSALIAKWQAKANKVWAKNPRLSAADVAAIIAEPNEKPNTVRRRIKKPLK